MNATEDKIIDWIIRGTAFACVAFLAWVVVEMLTQGGAK